MKTYTKTVATQEPRLVIHHDDTPQSPREWCNLGYFITKERNYKSPDGENAPEIQQIIEDTAQDATSTEDHMKLIKKAIKEQGEKVLYITPVYRYEHGGVVYRRGTASGFDYSNCGFYIVTDKTQKECGTPRKLFEKVIDDELETYTKYANGTVYGFVLHDESGDVIDSCWGFYDIDDIKEYLPKEYKNENMHDYLKY